MNIKGMVGAIDSETVLMATRPDGYYLFLDAPEDPDEFTVSWQHPDEPTSGQEFIGTLDEAVAYLDSESPDIRFRAVGRD